MDGNCSNSQPSPSNISGSSRAGLIRRDFLRSLGIAAASVGFGLPRSLTARTVDTSPVAAPNPVDCPVHRLSLELNDDGAEKARRYESDIATFQPWVGENYEAAPFQNRTLILGEADYEWKGGGDLSRCRNATRDLVTDLIAEPSDDGSIRRSSWIYLAMLFTNKWLYSLDERRRFWDGVAFYNYLQSPAGFGPDGVSTPAQWKDSEAAFLDVLRVLKPQFMAVLGDRLWDNLPLGRQIWNREGIPLFLYNYPGGSCLAVLVRQCCSRVHRK